MANRLQTLHDAEVALRPYVPLVAQLTGSDTTLDRIKPLMDLLGNPEQKLKIIHIAGTSGKTSTSYYTTALLQQASQKVGLTVSPHVDKISERVQINGRPISDELFCSELEAFLQIIEGAEQQPSYFELLYAFAMWVFARQEVDYAVIETGLGGLHDATNVAQRADKVCVITDIGFDHMQVLGNTLREIATQKIGIMHPANVGLTFQQPAEVMQAFADWVTPHEAQLTILSEEAERKSLNLPIDHLPAYQQRNWLLAYAVYRYVAGRDGLPELTPSQLAYAQDVQVPARMEIIEDEDLTVVMDGAHNAQKMTSFIASFQKQFPGVQPAVLLALKEGKEYETVSPLLADFADTIIVTSFATSQDLPSVSMDPEVLAEALRHAGAQSVQVVPDLRMAYDTLMQNPAIIKVVTGSFYLLSQLRRELHS